MSTRRGTERDIRGLPVSAVTTSHFVTPADLNHHGTLYAARTAGWFVETGLIAASACLPADDVVCVQIHGMSFTTPVRVGETVQFTGRAVLAEASSIVTHVAAQVADRGFLDGLITFVSVDESGRPQRHGIRIIPSTAEDVTLQLRARTIRDTTSALRANAQ